MIKKNSSAVYKKLFVILTCICTSLLISCADNCSLSNKYFGVQIKSMLPTGTIYKITTGGEGGFRCIIIKITNDTVIPVRLQIDFPSIGIDLNPLPGHKHLTVFNNDTIATEGHNQYR